MQQYSQLTALWAITKASLKAIFRSPQAVFFSMFFPVVLIIIFGTISGGGGASINVGIAQSVDRNNPVYDSIMASPILNAISNRQDTLEDKLKKGKITALIDSIETITNSNAGKYRIHLKFT